MLVVAQPSSEFSEGLMNYPVLVNSCNLKFKKLKNLILEMRVRETDT